MGHPVITTNRFTRYSKVKRPTICRRALYTLETITEGSLFEEVKRDTLFNAKEVVVKGFYARIKNRC